MHVETVLVGVTLLSLISTKECLLSIPLKDERIFCGNFTFVLFPESGATLSSILTKFSVNNLTIQLKPSLLPKQKRLFGTWLIEGGDSSHRAFQS